MVVAVLQPSVWVPPGLDPVGWRCALAEDLLDVLGGLAGVEVAVAAPAGEPDRLRAMVGWPGLIWYEYARPTVLAVLDAVAADGYQQAAMLVGDVPDLPGMIVAKLLRPLTTRSVVLAPAGDGAGLLGLAARLPAPRWLPEAALTELTPAAVRACAPRRPEVAVTAGWHRLQASNDLDRLDPSLEGWDATRAMLGRSSGRTPRFGAG